MRVFETDRSRAITARKPSVLQYLEYEMTLLFDMMASRNKKLSEQAYILYDKIQVNEDLDFEVEMRYMMLNHYFNKGDVRDD